MANTTIAMDSFCEVKAFLSKTFMTFRQEIYDEKCNNSEILIKETGSVNKYMGEKSEVKRIKRVMGWSKRDFGTCEKWGCSDLGLFFVRLR